MAKIYLVRHAEEAPKRHKGVDAGLSDLGRQQADAVAERLRPIGPMALVSSPSSRARETAAVLAEVWNVTPLIETAVSEIPSPSDECRAAWFNRVSTGSWRDAGDAVARWRCGVVNYLGGTHIDTVVFSHFPTINVAVGAATNDPRIAIFRPGNCSVTIFGNNNGILSLVERGSETPALMPHTEADLPRSK
jgi:broad specificity phosphatase PhoE